jgi:hypothetical protein
MVASISIAGEKIMHPVSTYHKWNFNGKEQIFRNALTKEVDVFKESG